MIPKTFQVSAYVIGKLRTQDQKIVGVYTFSMPAESVTTNLNGECMLVNLLPPFHGPNYGEALFKMYETLLGEFCPKMWNWMIPMLLEHHPSTRNVNRYDSIPIDKDDSKENKLILEYLRSHYHKRQAMIDFRYHGQAK